MRHLGLVIVLAAIIVAVAAVPLSSAASGTDGTSIAYDGTEYEYSRFSVPDYHSEMTGFDAGTDTFMRLQSRLEGYEVWKICDGVLADSENVTTFVIPAGVKEIGSNMFQGCTSLQSVIFLGPMPTFSEDTFAGIATEVSVVYLSDNADSWKDFTVLPASPLTVYTYDGDGFSFKYYEMDGTVTVYKHVSGTVINIPSSLDVGGDNVPVRYIGASAFFYDENSEQDRITKVTIPEGVFEIGVAAFKYCEYLEEVELPSTLKVIYDEAFRMPIDSVNWNRSALKAVSLPDGLEYIGFEAFRMCYSLKEVTVPDSVTHYGDGAFRVCAGMESITLGNGIHSLGESSFDNCHSLKHVTLPAALESIGEQCFILDRSLESITIPQTVKQIGASAFNGCTSLSEISMADDAVLGQGCFTNTSLLSLSVTSSSGDNGLVKFVGDHDWKLPGMSSALSMLVIDTDDAIDIGITGGGFIRLTDKAVNTNGGTFCIGGNEVTGADRAGTTYAYTDSWNSTEVGVLKVLSSDSTLGTVTPGGVYAIGTEVEVTATPKKYIDFVKWSDGVTDASRKITVSGDISITAEFVAAETVKLTIVIDPEGSGVYSGGGLYKKGATADISATPLKGYRFVRWSDGVTESARSIVMNDNMTITAEFVAEDMVLLAIQVDPEGSGECSGAGPYKKGTTANITATPLKDYHFAGWSDGVKEATRSIVMNEDTVLIAYFGNITISFDMNGGKESIDPVYSNAGSTIKLPSSDEKLDGRSLIAWRIAGEEYGVGSTYTVESSVTAVAVWESAPGQSDNTLIIIAAVVGMIVIIAAVVFIVKRFR